MKILRRDLKHDRMVVLPEAVEDIWELYNVISRDDEVCAKTTRQTKMEELYARPKKGKRISVYLCLKVQNVFWDRDLNRLRVHGIVCGAPKDFNITGSHHTLNVTVGNPIAVVKHEWAKHLVDRVERASRARVKPIIVLSIDDEAYCIAVLKRYGIDVKVEERKRLPGKFEAEKREKAKREYFKTALKFLRKIWTDLQSPVVIIGPGFIKNEFFNYVKNVVPDIYQAIVDVKGVNSAGLAGINEALRSGVLTKTLRHVRIAKEAALMEELLKRMGRGRSDVTYGFADVEQASSYGAVAKLLLADAMLREATEKERSSLEKLMREIEKKGGQIVVVNTEHEAGVKLIALGGTAAFLRFPIR